ncbi:hypothetical protein [Psychrosphaera algicola]|uniref:HEAT repeat domain-containing protein n=1 Tax=Psychrosphaera algicola TaxID=3023714 RepID=A0ABT5F8K1_9GAMM|nr:hypothetical protein [Psychrosphaera sp. G1-22]MDC2887862.1 hypothetical protein [Psychrosphaera sp. G1-22]
MMMSTQYFINFSNLDQSIGNEQLIATQFDLLKNALINQPNNVDELVDLLSNAEVNSNTFDTILVAIGALPNEDADSALLQIAEQYVITLDDETSRENFLAVLSNTTSLIKPDHMIRSLVEIAMLDQPEIDITLEALNFTEPHQLYESERTEITHKLNQLISNSSEEDAARMLPQLLRFSQKEQRTEIAKQSIMKDQPDSMRNAVLEGIGAGEISASEEMKIVLLGIAKDPNDALSTEAFEILNYAFDLSHQELSSLALNIGQN